MKKQARLIIYGFIFIVVLTVSVFSSLLVYMNHESLEDIRQISQTYLDGVANAEINNFNSISEIRHNQVTALRDILFSTDDWKDVNDSILHTAIFHDLVNVSLVSDQGEYLNIYGDPLIAVGNPELLFARMMEGSSIVMTGQNHSEQLITWTEPLDLELSDGTHVIGIISCRDIDQFIQKMNLESKETLAYFLLIRRDGSYVVQTQETECDTYFEKLLHYTVPIGSTSEEQVERLKAAIAANESWRTDLTYINNDRGIHERRSVLAAPLPSSNWYLVSILPFGQLDTAIENMFAVRMRATFTALLIVTLGILLVFLLYLRNSERQRKALETANINIAHAKDDADTARIEAEKARVEAEEANKAKSDFLSNMSHDIRTPMNAIVGMTALAVEHIDDKERVQDCLRKITLSGKHLLGLINDILDMSKIESGKMTLNPEVISLRQTMETMCDIIRPQIKANKQNFDIFISNILSEHVYCDSVRLNQVLLNFLSNALKFTPEGGKIFVDLRQEESPAGEAYVRTHLSISDTGMGMSPEFKEKLFHAFEREDNRRVHKTQGTGLGLTITKYIIDAMGGTIDVDTAPGVGTTFHVTLDLERVSMDGENMQLPDWRILIVDDNEELCRCTELSLTELGARPDWTLSGKDAVARVTAAEEAGDPYFIVLIDYKLDETNGIDTAKQIRTAVGNDLPIKLISAYDWMDIEGEAKAAGINGFIPKPLFKSTLYYELRKYMSDGSELSDEDKGPDSNTADISGMHILLAEDNELNAEIATMFLEENGATVDHAEDGLQALEKFENNPEGTYDAILMDLRMPNMNGLEASEAIRSLKRLDAVRIPIIAMTADAFAEDAQKCLEAGMNTHLAKPIDIEQLKRTLVKWVYQENVGIEKRRQQK
ncbi:MAG: response regulator [Blautia sp.]|nr:response regulator [Blautia sp.]